jgi:hypothetical protein
MLAAALLLLLSNANASMYIIEISDNITEGIACCCRKTTPEYLVCAAAFLENPNHDMKTL